MDKPTLDYYALHASEVAQRYEVAPSPLAHRFAESFSSGSRILDIGCGVELQRKVSHYLQPILSHRFLNNLA